MPEASPRTRSSCSRAWASRAGGGPGPSAPLARTPSRRVAVDGDDVVRWLGIAAGPLVGELLSRLRVAAAMGEVKNRREARHWLTGQVRKAP